MLRIYLDSMIWIYALEGNPKFGAASQAIFTRLRSASHTLLASHFLLAELLVLPVRNNDTFTVASYRSMILASATTEVVPFTAEVALQFASLRAFQRTQAPDSLNLALAASAKADIFLTNDTDLHKLTIPGIGSIVGLETKLF